MAGPLSDPPAAPAAPGGGGWGAEVAAEIQERAFDHLDAPVMRVGALDVPIPYSKPLEDFVIPDEERIIAAV